MLRINRQLALVFIAAFILNWIWEFSHSRLYLHYQGGSITGFILLRSALVDALIILILVFLAQKFNKPWFVLVGGLVVAAALEIWALQTGRWAYNSLMPIIPITRTGLSPTIQLAFTGFIAQRIKIL